MVDWPIGLECRSIKVSSNRKTNGYMNVFVSLLHTMGALLREWHSFKQHTHTLDQYIHDYIRAELCIKNNASRLKDSINVPNFTLHHAYLWFTIDSHRVSKAEESEKSFRTTGGVQLQCLASNHRNVLNRRRLLDQEHMCWLLPHDSTKCTIVSFWLLSWTI